MHVSLFGVESFDNVIALLGVARRALGEVCLLWLAVCVFDCDRKSTQVLSAFEFFDAASLDVVEEFNKGTKTISRSFGRDLTPTSCDDADKSPLERRARFYVLIETSGSAHDHDAGVCVCLSRPILSLIDHHGGVVAKVDKLLELAFAGDALASDGVIASSEQQAANIWALREGEF